MIAPEPMPRFLAWKPLLADLAQRHPDLPGRARAARQAGYRPEECWAFEMEPPALLFRRQFPTTAAEIAAARLAQA